MSTPLKPLLFLVDDEGTSGDRKPLAILAVLAAAVSQILPVTLAYLRNDDAAFRFLDKFAMYVLGDNFASRFKRMELNIYEYFRLKEGNTEYCVFSQGFRKQKDVVPLDFGDNYGPNRFSSFLIHNNRRATSLFFGAITLPRIEHITWSFGTSLVKVRAFHRQATGKIMLMAGTLRVPYFIEDILEWVEQHPEKEQWHFILLNYKTENRMHRRQNPRSDVAELLEKYQHRVLLWNEYTEFEDIMPYADFIVHNCGAGSATVPLMLGIPQACAWALWDIPGGDKQTNVMNVCRELQIGPCLLVKDDYYRSSFVTFDTLMKDATTNWTFYKHNARKIRRYIQHESATMVQNMRLFFTDLTLNADLQTNIQDTGQIPAKYTLYANDPPEHTFAG